MPDLEPLALDVAPGDCIAIQGRSGSGKTRLLRALADLDPVLGEVYLGGVSRDAISGPSWRLRVAYVGAESGWWSDRVGDHFRDWRALEAERLALRLPDDCNSWRVERTSTGERQRLGLLRTLENRPQALLLDEPTSGLDAEATAAAEKLVAMQRASGAGVLWVTHDGAQAGRVASRRLTLADGRLNAHS